MAWQSKMRFKQRDAGTFSSWQLACNRKTADLFKQRPRLAVKNLTFSRPKLSPSFGALNVRLSKGWWGFTLIFIDSHVASKKARCLFRIRWSTECFFVWWKNRHSSRIDEWTNIQKSKVCFLVAKPHGCVLAWPIHLWCINVRSYQVNLTLQKKMARY